MVMGRKKERKKTRANKEAALRAEIRERLAKDERFLRVAMNVQERHLISMEETIALVMDEYRVKIQHEASL